MADLPEGATPAALGGPHRRRTGRAALPVVPPSGEVGPDTLGLLPDQIRQGFGSHFLAVGVRLAWAVAPAVWRVWLHTSSGDHRSAQLRRAGVPSLPGEGTPDASALTKILRARTFVLGRHFAGLDCP